MLNVSMFAATATIVFSGLIIHHEFDPASHARRAVMIEDADHVPRVIIPAGARGKVSGNWTLVSGGSTGPWVYDISDVRLKVGGVTGGVTPGQRFKDHVPHLSKLLPPNTDLLDDVQHGNIGNGKHMAYIAYSGGNLDIKDCYAMEVQFESPDASDPKCVASSVTLTFTAGTTWTLEDPENSNKFIEIKGGKKIAISNEAPMGTGGHFDRYKNAIANGIGPRKPKETGRCCKQCAPTQNTCQKTEGVTVECSNTQWP